MLNFVIHISKQQQQQPPTIININHFENKVGITHKNTKTIIILLTFHSSHSNHHFLSISASICTLQMSDLFHHHQQQQLHHEPRTGQNSRI
mmetsp:Transcript_14781/g.27817  ORF Transcript_14781/g.27817 Transcript_14781/m.27817 type:complete len:91 (-) Transcript_14781:63-335(-)